MCQFRETHTGKMSDLYWYEEIFPVLYTSARFGYHKTFT